MLSKFRTIPIYTIDEECFFEKITGVLLKQASNRSTENIAVYSSKLNHFLELNSHPYNLAIRKTFTIGKKRFESFIKIYAIILTRLFSINFYLGRLFSKISIRVFQSSEEAVLFYRNYIYPNKQNDLCLARAFFAAATSKSFKENGLIFIGVFLPSKSMHAWIIEDRAMADPQDSIWLNYQPVAAIHYE